MSAPDRRGSIRCFIWAASSHVQLHNHKHTDHCVVLQTGDRTRASIDDTNSDPCLHSAPKEPAAVHCRGGATFQKEESAHTPSRNKTSMKVAVEESQTEGAAPRTPGSSLLDDSMSDGTLSPVTPGLKEAFGGGYIREGTDHGVDLYLRVRACARSRLASLLLFMSTYA
jgi:hypothetical protein